MPKQADEWFGLRDVSTSRSRSSSAGSWVELNHPSEVFDQALLDEDSHLRLAARPRSPWPISASSTTHDSALTEVKSKSPTFQEQQLLGRLENINVNTATGSHQPSATIIDTNATTTSINGRVNNVVEKPKTKGACTSTVPLSTPQCTSDSQSGSASSTKRSDCEAKQVHEPASMACPPRSMNQSEDHIKTVHSSSRIEQETGTGRPVKSRQGTCEMKTLHCQQASKCLETRKSLQTRPSNQDQSSVLDPNKYAKLRSMAEQCRNRQISQQGKLTEYTYTQLTTGPAFVPTAHQAPNLSRQANENNLPPSQSMMPPPPKSKPSDVDEIRLRAREAPIARKTGTYCYPPEHEVMKWIKEAERRRR